MTVVVGKLVSLEQMGRQLLDSIFGLVLQLEHSIVVGLELVSTLVQTEQLGRVLEQTIVVEQLEQLERMLEQTIGLELGRLGEIWVVFPSKRRHRRLGGIDLHLILGLHCIVWRLEGMEQTIVVVAVVLEEQGHSIVERMRRIV